MAAENQRKTFLSYSRANKDFAIRLAKELKSEGFDIWLDQLDIPLGARWDVEVERALEESEIFMIIMTPASIGSENVRDEIGYAIDNGKRFLPVLLENCTVPLRLRRFQYVDFTNKSFDDGVEAAKGLLRGLVAQPTISRAEFSGAQVQADAERKTKEEADRLAMLQAEEERLAKEKADLERRIKEEAERLYAQKAEEERRVKAKADAERKAKTEARRKAKEDADRLAAQKAEEERLNQAKAVADRKAKEDAEEALTTKAEAEGKEKEEGQLAKQKIVELAAKAKTEGEHKLKEDQNAKTEEFATKVDFRDEQKIETISTLATPISPTPKKPNSRVLLIGFVIVVLFVIAGFGIKAILNRGEAETQKSLVTRDLIYYDNNKYHPDLIENWESNSDHSVWTFYLSQGVILQNGDPFTSSTVESYLSIKNMGASGKANVEIVDDLTFTVTLSKGQESQDIFRALSEQGYICWK